DVTVLVCARVNGGAGHTVARSRRIGCCRRVLAARAGPGPGVRFLVAAGDRVEVVRDVNIERLAANDTEVRLIELDPNGWSGLGQGVHGRASFSVGNAVRSHPSQVMLRLGSAGVCDLGPCVSIVTRR